MTTKIKQIRYLDLAEIFPLIATPVKGNVPVSSQDWMSTKLRISSEKLSSMPKDETKKLLLAQSTMTPLNGLFCPDGKDLIIRTGIVREVKGMATGIYTKSFFKVIWNTVEALKKIDPTLVIKFDHPDLIQQAIININNAAELDTRKNENCIKQNVSLNELVKKIDFLLEEYPELQWQRLGVKSFNIPVDAIDSEMLDRLLCKFLDESPGIELLRNTYRDENEQSHFSFSLMLLVGYIDRGELEIEWDPLEYYLSDRRDRLWIMLMEG